MNSPHRQLLNLNRVHVDDCLHHRELTQAGKTSPRIEAKQKTINLKGPLTLSMDPQEDNTDSVLTEVGDED